jgi:hypothetical protein
MNLYDVVSQLDLSREHRDKSRERAVDSNHLSWLP